ncbi:MAG: hypothetical protein ABEJ40_04795 [Haloarculaceae archaeon]
MARSILGLVGLGTTLVFALPAALYGVELLVRGDTYPGIGLVVVAVLMVAVEEYVTTPGDLPAAVAGRVLGAVAKTPDDEE